MARDLELACVSYWVLVGINGAQLMLVALILARWLLEQNDGH